MNIKLIELIKNIPKALKSPVLAAKLFWRRIVPFGIKPKDPEAYRIGSWSYGNLPRVYATEVFPGIENFDVLILRAFDKTVSTSLDPLEILLLVSISKFIGAKNILEIGTWDGNTALNLAANSADDAVITTVDLPPDWNGKLHVKVPALYVNVTDREKTGIQFIGTRHEKKIKQIYGDSAELDWDSLPGPFDLIFLDGCHALNYIKLDTNNSLNHLKPGGLLIWHDYGMIEDVSIVVDELAQSKKIYAFRGTRLAIGIM